MFTKDEWNNDFYETGYTPWRREEIDLNSWLDTAEVRSGKAMDLGCGTGEVAIWLSNHGFEVEGLDFSQTALDIARTQSNKPRWVEWNLENLKAYDFRYELYDLIIDSKVLPFIKNKKQYLSTISQRLTEDGIFILHVMIYHDEDERVYIQEEYLETLLDPLFEIKHIVEVPTRAGKEVRDYFLMHP